VRSRGLKVRFWRTLREQSETSVVVKLLLRFLRILMSLRWVIDNMLATLRGANLLSNLLWVGDVCHSNLAYTVPIGTLTSSIALPWLSLSWGWSSIICGLVWLDCGFLCVGIVGLLIHSIHHQHEESVVLVIVVVTQSWKHWVCCLVANWELLLKTILFKKDWKVRIETRASSRVSAFGSHWLLI
jgi:hypothetical protein